MAPDPVPTPGPASAQLRQTRYFTWEEVAQRSGREKERWLVIDRKVYNISDFSRRHPGAPGSSATTRVRMPRILLWHSTSTRVL